MAQLIRSIDVVAIVVGEAVWVIVVIAFVVVLVPELPLRPKKF